MCVHLQNSWENVIECIVVWKTLYSWQKFYMPVGCDKFHLWKRCAAERCGQMLKMARISLSPNTWNAGLTFAIVGNVHWPCSSLSLGVIMNKHSWRCSRWQRPWARWTKGWLAYRLAELPSFCFPLSSYWASTAPPLLPSIALFDQRNILFTLNRTQKIMPSPCHKIHLSKVRTLGPRSRHCQLGGIWLD